MCSSVKRIALTATMILALAATTFSRSPFQTSQTKQVRGSISGRVTIEDRPARGVTVSLFAEDSSSGKLLTKATSDHEGRFQLRSVPAGSYRLQAFAPALVAAGDSMFGRFGKAINLLEGEDADVADIALKPGGVITGRVTDAEGQPVIQETIRLFRVDSNNQQGGKQPIYLPFNFMFSTDDRGVYRLFGLPPARYLVAVGVESNGPNARINVGNTYYPLTYHPDSTEEAKGIVVEVASGGEATGVDIVLGRASKGYSVTGRIIDATTGKPVVGMSYGYGVRHPQSERFNMTASGGSTSNARGEFRLEGLTPGQYAAFGNPAPDSDVYSDTGLFTITDSDVAGVVVKVHVGSIIIGNVVIEGAEGQPGAPRASEVRLGVMAGSLNVAPKNAMVRISPDGSFRINGLPRGIASFNIFYPAPKGLALLRVERDGVEQKNGIEVGSAEEITGVKVVFAYGTGSIRGQVKVEGGEISSDTMMFLNLRRVGSNEGLNRSMPSVDSRGRFVIDGLQPGEYELSLMFRTTSPDGGRPVIISKDVKQTVEVTNGTESQVTMVVDLTAK